MGAPATVTLSTGLRMEREEFLRRWEELPDLKRAELIDGVVYVPSPVGDNHAAYHMKAVAWIDYYQSATPGCRAGDSPTMLMLDSAPQPDVALWSTASGKVKVKGTFPEGAPELIFEVSSSSAARDRGPKRALYQRAGVREYITAEIPTKRIVWRELVDGSYRTLQPGADGVIRSRVFPGLWLDVAAFWAMDSVRLRKAVDAGLEHARKPSS